MSDDPQKTLLDAISSHRSMLRNIASEFDDISDAANLLGLALLAQRIASLSDELVASGDRLNKAYGDALYDTVRASEQATMNMVNGVLAGIEMAERSK